MEVIIDKLVVRFDTLVVADATDDWLPAAVAEPEVEQGLTVLN
jgi:hypothetical protein